MSKEVDKSCMTLGEACDEFLVYIENVRGFSHNSVIGYGEDLKHLIAFSGEDTLFSQITLQDLKSCVGELSRKNYKPATINRFIAATRGLFAYCRKFHYIQYNIALELKTVRIPKRLPRYMTQSEIDAMCRSPEEKKLLWPARDKALFEMLYSSGCRVSEIAGLKFGDFSSGYESALVLGKGSKERRVYFEKDARSALKLYLDEREKRFPVTSRKGAFTVKNIFVNQKGRPLTTQGIWYIVTRYSGIEGTNKYVSPHAFRHTFATQMLNNGADIRMVQEMLGHSSISTTQRYTHVTKENLKETYNQAFPHSGKKD